RRPADPAASRAARPDATGLHAGAGDQALRVPRRRRHGHGDLPRPDGARRAADAGTRDRGRRRVADRGDGLQRHVEERGMSTVAIPRGWVLHPVFSPEARTLIVPDVAYWGAREDPPTAADGWLWRYDPMHDGYRLERDPAGGTYRPDLFTSADAPAIWDAVKAV